MSNILKTVVLIILDGWGIAPAWGGNAISLAQTNCFDNLWKTFPKTTLKASGEAVGLPGNERGNSEAGHLNIGAGKIVHQDVDHIFNLIKDGSFFNNPVLLDILTKIKKNNSNLHLFGLISDGGIHSHINQLYALLELCQKEKVNNVFIHAFTDGRDSPPQSALTYLSSLDRKLKEIGFGKISSVSGRYYAMDRDKHWGRTEQAYSVISSQMEARKVKAGSAISGAYQKGLTDEFITPTAIDNPGIKDNDGIIFFNVRGDRARQLTLAFTDPHFKQFEVKKYKNLLFSTFTWYGEYLKNTQFAFAPEEVKKPLARIFSDQKLAQFHTAETEKYPHVTYFFNGGQEQVFPLEERKMLPSPKVNTYDLKPEMSASEVTKELLKAISNKNYSFILVNYANPDMVGHTGNLKAAIKAVETVDKQLEKVINKSQETMTTLLITADHGNVEQMVNPKTGEIDTEHSINPVPFILVNPDLKGVNLRPAGILADIAPTVLDLIKIEKPKEMTGQSLLEELKISLREL